MENMPVASVTAAKLKPDASIDEARKVWNENIIPAIKGEKGFIGGFLLVAEDKGDSIALVLYESRADAEAVQKSGLYRKQVAKFVAFIDKIEDRKIYDVNSEITLK
ncbi:hypothetical protein ES703_80746 [subsurface metagenome]